MTQIKWEEPPARKRNRNSWTPIAQALRDNPNKWALVAEDVGASIGTHIRHGRLMAFAPEGAFEARVYGVNPNRGGRAEKIYARYVGEEQAEEPTEADKSDAEEIADPEINEVHTHKRTEINPIPGQPDMAEVVTVTETVVVEREPVPISEIPKDQIGKVIESHS